MQIDLQRMIDAMSDMDCQTRGNYHLTLGGLRDALAEASGNLPVIYADGTAVGTAGSYRGYYTDIALDDADDPVTVAEMRDFVAAWLEEIFHGYKGGDYPASPEKPLWRSDYGMASGIAIMDAMVVGDRFVLMTKKID